MHPVIARILPASDCLAGAESHAVRIADVTDGDSLVLDGGHRLRLIGINALELHSFDEQERTLARDARAVLRSFLDEQQAFMIPGLETRDSYGRTLAHIRLADGRSAAHALVAEGMALAVAVGANTRCARSLLKRERRARERRLGLWESPGTWYNPKTLSGKERGFHVIAGKVIDVSGRGARTTLHLSNGLLVMLGRHWPPYGSTHTLVPDTLTGSKVQVRGWLDFVNGQQQMILHHPDNLELK